MDEDVLILDADSIAYKAAAANEARSITATHKQSGDVTAYDNVTAFRAVLKAQEKDVEEDYIITPVQEPRHVSYARSQAEETIKKYHRMTGVDKHEIYIGGADNFRDSIPLPTRYKGGRDNTIRPVQLKDVRYHMIQNLGAIVVEGQEVDDVGSIRAYEGWKANKGKVIQVTCDKDALQCNGWLLNPDKMASPVYIQGFGELHREGKGVKGTGRLWLYFQALWGDPVDDYSSADLYKQEHPTYQFGAVGAYLLLKDCKTDAEAWKVLYTQYKTWYPNPLTYTDWSGDVQTKDAVEIMQMYFDCAFMRRWENDRIIVKDVLTKLGVL